MSLSHSARFLVRKTTTSCTGCAKHRTQNRKSLLAAAVHTELQHSGRFRSSSPGGTNLCLCRGEKSASGAYFEGRLPADVHKQHVVSLQHVLKHLLAGKSADSRPG